MYFDMNFPPIYHSAGIRYFDKGEKHITRIFDNDVLILVFDGILRFKENGKEVEVKSGYYYIQQSGLLQEGHIASELPKYIYVHFNGRFTDNSDHGIPVFGEFDTDRLLPYTERLISSENSYKSTLVAKTCLFYTLLDCIASKPDITISHPQIAENIADYISNNYKQAIKISDIAHALSYSEDYIIRSFRHRYHTTPHKYITMLRMQYAKELLLTTDRTSERIASECGYSDLSVFYKTFLKFYKCTPTELKTRYISI